MNEPLEQPRSITSAILEKIKAGKIQAHSKVYFVIQSIIAALGVALVACLLVFASSFVFFTLHQTGAWFAPGFGRPGWAVLWSALPWVFILVVVGLVIVLELLLRRYAVVYRRPVLYSAVALGVLAVVFGLLAAQTPFHHKAYQYARDKKPPFFGGLYQGYSERPFKGMVVGRVSDLPVSGLTLVLRDNSELLVEFSNATRFPNGRQFQVGDMVLVVGERQGNTIQAIGVKKVDDDFDFMPMRPRSGGRMMQLPGEINLPRL